MKTSAVMSNCLTLSSTRKRGTDNPRSTYIKRRPTFPQLCYKSAVYAPGNILFAASPVARERAVKFDTYTSGICCALLDQGDGYSVSIEDLLSLELLGGVTIGLFPSRVLPSVGLA